MKRPTAVATEATHNDGPVATTSTTKTSSRESNKNGKVRVVRRRKKRLASSSSNKGGGPSNYENAIVPSVIILAFTAFIVLFRFVHTVSSLPEIDLGEGGGGGGNGGGKGPHDVAARKERSSSKRAAGAASVRAVKPNGLRHDHDNNKQLYPDFKWPVSIRDEDGDFEDVLHPGDGKTVMSLPRYFSAPIAGEDGRVGSLLDRDVATRFGSYVDGVRDTDHGNKGDPNKRTVFVAVASYRDWQCRYTVESLLTTAKFPNRVRIVVVDQIHDDDPSCGVPIKPCEDDPDQGLCKYVDQVDVIEIPAELAVGPVFARYVGHRLYRGEYYAMQVDAHVTFVKDWDVDIIAQMDSTKNEMAVISTYLTDIEGSIDKVTGKSKRRTRPIMCNTDFEGGGTSRHLRHNSQPEARPSIAGMPQMQPYWAAGWSFARGHFVVQVPYDLYLPMVFMGEESSIGIRAFTFGYDHYAAERSICFHTYANGPNAAKRSKVHHFWENGNKYRGAEQKSMKRLLGIIGMNPEVDPSEWDHTDEKLYGIGHARTTADFHDTFGIHLAEKTVEHHLCQFVQTGRMHRTFLPFLRENGMGLDYSKIHFRFKDPRPGQK